MSSATDPSDSIMLSNKACSLKIYLFGAHVTSFQVDGSEKLWMSSLSKMDGSAPIRGGIPIAFPQFADEGPMKLHGFARESLWTLVDAEQESCVLELKDSDVTRKLWPHRFQLRYAVKLLPRGVKIELEVKNSGDSEFSFTGCFHTYFRFEDTSSVELHGLDGATYIDKADRRNEKIQDGGTLKVKEESEKSAKSAGVEYGFVDRIYLNTGNEYKYTRGDETLYEITHSASWTDTTIYNPWLGDKQGDKGPDFDDDGYKYTICCEPTLSGRHAVTLESGERWTGSQQFVVPE